MHDTALRAERYVVPRRRRVRAAFRIGVADLQLVVDDVVANERLRVAPQHRERVERAASTSRLGIVGKEHTGHEQFAARISAVVALATARVYCSRRRVQQVGVGCETHSTSCAVAEAIRHDHRIDAINCLFRKQSK